MNLQRFTTLVSAYGTRAESWPVEERGAAEVFLQQNPEAQNLLKAEISLDQKLDSFFADEMDVGGLRANIINATINAERVEKLTDRDGLLDQILDWLLPLQPVQLWRPALAATLPLILGGLLGTSIETGQYDSGDYWEDELEIMAIASSSSVNEDFQDE
jgi:hypothetical protein